MEIEAILRRAVDCGASDIFVAAGLPLTFKIKGEQQRTGQPYTPADSGAFAAALYRLAGRESYCVDGSRMDDDFSCSVSGIGRFRVNLFRQRGTLAAVVRVIRFGLPKPEEFHIPPEIMAVKDCKKGLVLVTGQAGSGKTTTLACIVDAINHSRSGHILTLEDPVEYIYTPDQCLINQREVGRDTMSFAAGLRAALREDPDVILVGEMRDLDTIQTALTAAETGHLVFGTVHTNSAADSIDRIVDVFPAERQQQIRLQLSMTLKAVLSQQLLPRAQGGGRVLACEVMKTDDAIRNLIREGKTPQIQNAIQTSGAIGNILMDRSLQNLYRSGAISRQTMEGALRGGLPQTPPAGLQQGIGRPRGFTR